MSLIINESFEYQHKKFNHGKRPRDDGSSNSSQSGDDEDQLYIDVETVEEEIPNTYNYHESEMSTTTTSTSPYKRPRTESFGSTTSYSAFSPLPPPTRVAVERHTSTPYMTDSSSISPNALEPTAAILPKISTETLASICKYHGNMVRKFPKKQRTPKEQERRDKNTIACRMSRRVKKLEHVAIEEQYKEFTQQTFEIIEQAMRSTVYLQELMKLSNAIGNVEMTHGIFFDIKREEGSATPEKKSFSIAYLVGNEE
ncbi:protein Mabiki-like [Musca vetustissima]|uniref:protein Mabiki-like n=1 Tax=Musca vetustissima TaxID=27455 RepID=UPI002AB5EAF0|nr:protein Mabiki-like [Musca vetustissima]